MRQCKKCDIELVKGTQFKSDENKFNICKKCRKTRSNKHYANNTDSYIEKGKALYNSDKAKWKAINKENNDKTKDGLNHVYTTKCMYAGVTDNTYKRAREHSKMTCIVFSSKDRKDALEIEGLLHDMGYTGRHTNNRYA